MKTKFKQIVALAVGTFLFCGLSAQETQAQVVSSGTATLATVGTAPGVAGTATAPPAITVNYQVTLASGVYTYQYTVNNPSGNVILPVNTSFKSAGTPTVANPKPGATGPNFVGNGNAGKPAAVNSFSVNFDTTASGAYTAVTPPAGIIVQNNGVNGLLWIFGGPSPGIAPNNSMTVSFQSANLPILVNACAMGPNPPGPWASNPSGQQVPVPFASGTATLAGVGVNGYPAVKVNYSVSLAEPSGIYTYTYVVNDPSGSINVNQFFLNFDTTATGAYLPNSQTGAGANSPENSFLSWNLDVQSGSSRGPLSFQSNLAPAMGDASAANGGDFWAGNLPVPYQ